MDILSNQVLKADTRELDIAPNDPNANVIASIPQLVEVQPTNNSYPAALISNSGTSTFKYTIPGSQYINPDKTELRIPMSWATGGGGNFVVLRTDRTALNSIRIDYGATNLLDISSNAGDVIQKYQRLKPSNAYSSPVCLSNPVINGCHRGTFYARGTPANLQQGLRASNLINSAGVLLTEENFLAGNVDSDSAFSRQIFAILQPVNTATALTHQVKFSDIPCFMAYKKPIWLAKNIVITVSLASNAELAFVSNATTTLAAPSACTVSMPKLYYSRETNAAITNNLDKDYDIIVPSLQVDTAAVAQNGASQSIKQTVDPAQAYNLHSIMFFKTNDNNTTHSLYGNSYNLAGTTVSALQTKLNNKLRQPKKLTGDLLYLAQLPNLPNNSDLVSPNQILADYLYYDKFGAGLFDNSGLRVNNSITYEATFTNGSVTTGNAFLVSCVQGILSVRGSNVVYGSPNIQVAPVKEEA